MNITTDEFWELVVPVRKFIMSRYFWHDWEDVVQNTMISIWRSLEQGKYDPEKSGDISSWAVGFAKFSLMNHYRHDRRRIDTVPIDPARQKDEMPTFVVNYDEDPEELLRSFLTPDENVVLTCLLSGMGSRGAREVLGCGTNVVTQHRREILDTMYELWPHLQDPDKYGPGKDAALAEVMKCPKLSSMTRRRRERIRKYIPDLAYMYYCELRGKEEVMELLGMKQETFDLIVQNGWAAQFIELTGLGTLPVALRTGRWYTPSD